MFKGIFIFLISLIIAPTFKAATGIKKAPSEGANLALKAVGSCLMEAETKKVLYESGSHTKLFPASMTKMMGMILLLEGIEEKKISFDDEVSISPVAASMGGTQIYLEVGEKMSVRDLFKSVAINSANDAIVALGEHLSGSLENFIKAMNDKVAVYGLKDTHFNNATGFDDPEHYSSAYDMAFIGANLVSYEEIFAYCSLKEGYVRENTDKKFWLVNTNRLLGHYEGLDGLKTGFTSMAGFNFTGTALRNGVRLVSTVMKEKTKEDRTQDTIKLLNYGFSVTKAEVIYEKDKVVGSYKFKKSLNEIESLFLARDAKIYLFFGETSDDYLEEIIITKDTAPLKEGEVVGYMKFSKENDQTYEFPIYVAEVIKKSTFIDYLLHNLERFFL